MNRTTTLTLALLLVSCSDGTMPTPRGGTQTSNDNGTGDPTQAASLSPEQRLRDLQAKNAAEEIELANLRDINQKLCERLQQLRNQCASTYRLLASLGDATLACAAGNNAGTTLVSGSFQLQFHADGREYRILADNNWESNAFANGTHTLTWKARLPTSTQAPRLIDMTQIRIIPKDGQAIPAGTPAAFVLQVNGSTAFSTGDVARSQESAGYWLVSMQRLTELRESPQCKVTMMDVNAIVEQVRAASQNATAVAPAQSN